MAGNTPRIPNIEIEGARLLYRNFSGIEKKYNPAGMRVFNVVVPNEMVEDLMRDGWNVKPLKLREGEEAEEQQYTLKVKVRYTERSQPRVVMLTSRGRTNLTEESIGVLDFAKLVNADLTIRPYVWEDDGEVNVTAYLNSLWATVEEDRFEAKYAEMESEHDHDN